MCALKSSKLREFFKILSDLQDWNWIFQWFHKMEINLNLACILSLMRWWMFQYDKRHFSPGKTYGVENSWGYFS
jgi:hypothetical protein